MFIDYEDDTGLSSGELSQRLKKLFTLEYIGHAVNCVLLLFGVPSAANRCIVLVFSKPELLVLSQGSASFYSYSTSPSSYSMCTSMYLYTNSHLGYLISGRFSIFSHSS